MTTAQAGILQPVPRLARYLTFSMKPDANYILALNNTISLIEGEKVVLGLGASLISALDAKLDGMRDFPVYSNNGIDVPSTPAAVWCWLRGDDRGEFIHTTRALTHALQSAFQLESVIDAFQYGESRDLTGYIDGTENPNGDDALDAGIVHGKGPGLDGSSFVAVQQWVHNLDHFQAMAQQEQDNVIGRRRSDNKELSDAPESAHVRRTAQESFQPAAFVLRRSMPWADSTQQGLVFVAFGQSFKAFDALLKRMTGLEDGISDALFRISKPISGCFFWCPPMKGKQLDLSVLAL